jgi:hypothetical protein
MNMNHIAKDGSNQQVRLRGRIISIEVIIGKPYNGTSTNAPLYIVNDSFAGTTINTKQAGRRFWDEFAAVGARTGDILDITKNGIYHDYISIVFQATDQSIEALPEIEIIFIWSEL